MSVVLLSAICDIVFYRRTCCPSGPPKSTTRAGSKSGWWHRTPPPPHQSTVSCRPYNHSCQPAFSFTTNAYTPMTHLYGSVGQNMVSNRVGATTLVPSTDGVMSPVHPFMLGCLHHSFTTPSASSPSIRSPDARDIYMHTRITHPCGYSEYMG